MIWQFLKKFRKQGLHLPPQEVCEFTGNDVASTELSMNTQDHLNTELSDTNDSVTSSDTLPSNNTESINNLNTTHLRIRAGGCTARGSRERNDDSYKIHGSIFAISDGIGGAEDGDVMSRVGCGASIERHVLDRAQGIVGAFVAGNDAAVRVAKWIDNPSCGATLLLAEFVNNKMKFAWAGDTIAYLLRSDNWKLVTEKGRLSPTDNALESAIGYNLSLVPHTCSCDVMSGDRFLLCTDGVWEIYERVLGMDRLVELLGSSNDNPPYIASSIVKEAADVGWDNATAIVIFIERDEENGYIFPPSERDLSEAITLTTPRSKTY